MKKVIHCKIMLDDVDINLLQEMHRRSQEAIIYNNFAEWLGYKLTEYSTEELVLIAKNENRMLCISAGNEIPQRVHGRYSNEEN